MAALLPAPAHTSWLCLVGGALLPHSAHTFGLCLIGGGSAAGSTAHLCIRQSLTESGEWSFFSDSDLCGNAEEACMRRSQLGYVTMCGCAPITWSSKVTTVRFREYDAPAGYSWGRPVVANSGIADNHADVSSAASELYAAGTCVMDVLALRRSRLVPSRPCAIV